MEDARSWCGHREIVLETIATAQVRERGLSPRHLVGENLEKGLGCGCVLKAEGTELIDVVLKKKESARNELNLGRRADKG